MPEDKANDHGAKEISRDEPSAEFEENFAISPSPDLRLMSLVPLRVTRLVFIFAASTLVYILLPIGDFLAILNFDFDVSARRQYLLSGVQKSLFLVLAVVLLWQLKKLVDDLSYRLRSPMFSSLDISGDKTPSSPNRSKISGLEIQHDIGELVEEAAAESGHLDAVRVFRNFRARMKKDISRLSSISTRNLLFGLGFSFAALLFIASPLIFAANLQEAAVDSARQGADAVNWLLRYYLPRFGVGLLLQFVGFFFLRLYVANEQDIKHNSNEITNLEAKMMALQVASERNDENLFIPIIEKLASTERNFILKKNEKVIHEDDRRYNDLSQMLQVLGNFIEKRQPDEVSQREGRRGKKLRGSSSDAAN